MPKVSVIIPTYNRGGWVTEAIDSVLAQRETFADFETIVVDDGSTDDTQDRLFSYGNRIRVIRQENAGVSAARNAGIRAAAGDLLAFLDSDDYWLPGKLSAQVRFFHENPAAAVCQTQEIWIRNGRRIYPRPRHQKRAGDIFTASLELCLVSPSAVMIAGRVLDRFGLFDETLPACEDYELWLRIGCRLPIDLIDRPLIVKRGGHGDQLSAGWGLDRYRIAALKKLIDGGSINETQRKAAVETLAAKCRVYIEGCRKRGKTAEAAAYRRLMDACREKEEASCPSG